MTKHLLRGLARLLKVRRTADNLTLWRQQVSWAIAAELFHSSPTLRCKVVPQEGHLDGPYRLLWQACYVACDQIFGTVYLEIGPYRVYTRRLVALGNDTMLLLIHFVENAGGRQISAPWESQFHQERLRAPHPEDLLVC